ncbi:MAG: RDD family protein [Candidatus Acidiferrales bacterium]
MICAACGATTPEGKPFCSSCGRPLVGFSVGRAAAQSPAPDFSPAPSSTDSLAVPRTEDYAGFWLRVPAAMIDLIILAIPLAMAVSYLSVAMGSWRAFLSLHPGQPPQEIVAAFGRPYLFLILCFFIVTSWLYFAFCESSTWQGTPGKKFIGLRVADLRGNRVTFGRASGRFFAGRFVAHVPFLGSLYFALDCICAGLTSRKQALHDRFSGCLVLRKNEGLLYRE